MNEELKALKKNGQELLDGQCKGSNTKDNEVQRQQGQMTTIVANKIHDMFDRLGALTKHRNLLIVDLQHKHNLIEEVIQ